MSSILLKDYIGTKDLTESLRLTKDLSFHWANWDETCLIQRKHYKNFNNNFHLMRLNHSLQELKSQPIWLCNKVKVMKSDLYSLYESYLDSRLRMTWFDRKDEILFSKDSEQGPYFTLTSMKWFDKDIYSQFVMRKILLEHFTLRSFRLNANIPLQLKLDNDVNKYGDKASIHQISEAGFIIKIQDKNFINKIKNSTLLEIKIPINQYKKVEHIARIEDVFKKLDEKLIVLETDYKMFKLESRILNFYGNMNNALRSSDEEFCIFAKYEDLVPHGHDMELVDIFAPIVHKTKNQFMEYVDEEKSLLIKNKKSA